jgi:hypothetical protein
MLSETFLKSNTYKYNYRQLFNFHIVSVLTVYLKDNADGSNKRLTVFQLCKLL